MNPEENHHNFYEYSIAELADIHFVYRESHGNAREAVCLYQERFPNRRLPSVIPSDYK
jgi:hypothetical protein